MLLDFSYKKSSLKSGNNKIRKVNWTPVSNCDYFHFQKKLFVLTYVPIEFSYFSKLCKFDYKSDMPHRIFVFIFQMEISYI